MTYTIDESLSDTDFTPNGLVGAAFGTPRRYESITVHHWGSFGQTHMGVVNFFMQPNSPTSAHFVASDNLIHCLVSPQDASWAAGNAYGNATSIHIECRPEATAGDYATIAWLIARLRSIYGDLPLKPHSAWAPTACPGRYDLARIDREARGITPLSGTITPITEEGFLMALSDADQIEVRDNLRKLVGMGFAEVTRDRLSDAALTEVVGNARKTVYGLADVQASIAALPAADIAAAIPDELAQQVVDALAERLAK